MAWWLQKIAALTALGGCLAMVGTARADEPQPPSTAPLSALPPGWLAAKVNERGQHCEARAQRREAKKLLLACGAAGVWEIALDEGGPRFVRSFEFAGDVVGFFSEPDGQLWVKLQVLEARPFSARASEGAVVFPDPSPAGPISAPPPVEGALPAPPASPAPPAPPAPLAQRAQRGRVLRSAPGEVVISLGTIDGISRSDRIELALERSEDALGEDFGLSRETLAVGVVTDVNGTTARVRLGLNEDVPTGALATPTHAQITSSLSAPPRVSRLWQLELLARPFAALGELGGGALLSGAFGVRLAHLHLQAILDPLALGDVQDKDALTAVSAGLLASYDSQYFEMGLGLGAQTVNEAGFFVNPGSGLAALQVIRLGTLDGLNISARTNIVLFHSEFQFGGMVASGQIPVTRGYWLLLNGGGGNIGYGYGELGLRVLLTGNGLAGSKFLTVTAGGAAIFTSGHCDDFFACQPLTYGGPMAGVGGEWRF